MSCSHAGIGLPGCPTCDPRTGPRTGASNREPPAVPEIPEGWTSWENPRGQRCFRWQAESLVTLDELRSLLATQGLRIIGPEEAAVLDAMAALPDPLLTGMKTWPHFADPIKAELARRGGAQFTCEELPW